MNYETTRWCLCSSKPDFVLLSKYVCTFLVLSSVC